MKNISAVIVICLVLPSEIMKPGIKKFVSANLLQGTPEEILPAYYGFIPYYGTGTMKLKTIS